MFIKFDIQIAHKTKIANPKPPFGIFAKAVEIALIIKNGKTKARIALKNREIE
jgi:hypothetical protein